MYGMFANKANCNPDISNWNTSSVTDFVSQFAASTFLLRLYSVEHYESKQTNTSLTLSFFSTSQYHHYSPRYYDDRLEQYGILLLPHFRSQLEMFRGATSFNQDVSTWDTSSGNNFVSGLGP